MDEIRSSPVMVLVTYPRAPARITEPTSCGESDTDSARNAEAGESGCDLARISAPPPPSPPGTCTSSSTTSGLMSAIIAIEPSTSAACPTMWKYGCSVAMTPARNISWSSQLRGEWYPYQWLCRTPRRCTPRCRTHRPPLASHPLLMSVRCLCCLPDPYASSVESCFPLRACV